MPSVEGSGQIQFEHMGADMPRGVHPLQTAEVSLVLGELRTKELERQADPEAVERLRQLRAENARAGYGEAPEDITDIPAKTLGETALIENVVH